MCIRDRVKRGRDDTAVSSALKNLQVHARRDEVNLMPDIIECVSHDATVGEICDTCLLYTSRCV